MKPYLTASIVILQSRSGKLLMLCKGADSAIVERLADGREVRHTP